MAPWLLRVFRLRDTRLGSVLALLVGMMVSTSSTGTRAEDALDVKRDGADGETQPAPPVTALAFAPDGSKLLVGSQKGIEVRSWPDLHVDRALETELAHVHDLAFSPDGTRFAASGGEPAADGRLEVRSWPEGRLVHASSPYDDLLYAIAWSPDAKQIAGASYDGTVGVHEAESGKLVRKLEGHSRGVLGIAYADAETLVSAGVDLSLRVWNPHTGARRRVLDNHTGPVFDLSTRPAEAEGGLPMIASASADRTVRLWQPTIGRLVRFVRLPAKPLAVEWTANGRSVVAVSDDGRLRVIDPDSVEVIEEIAAVEGWAWSVAVAPGGDEVAAGGERGEVRRLALGARRRTAGGSHEAQGAQSQGNEDDRK